MSKVLRESSGDIRPDLVQAFGADQLLYEGGGPFEYICVVGLTTAIAAIVFSEEYDRSLLIWSKFSG